MQTQSQWGDHRACPEVGKIGGSHIKVYSYAERRSYGTTCSHPFPADSGTFFETVRTDRQVILHGVAMLVERKSLRAMCRLNQCKLDPGLHWVELAGQQAAAVSRRCMTGLPLPQAQIDELWTFIKKHRHTCKRVISLISGMPGLGEPARCPGACEVCIISHTTVVRKKRAPSWPKCRPDRMVAPPDVLPTHCQRLWRPSSPLTAPLNHPLSSVGLGARASPRVGSSLQSCVTPSLTNVVSTGGLLQYVGE
jgi:hypothetical protein